LHENFGGDEFPVIQPPLKCLTLNILPALSAEQQTWLTLTVYYDKDSTIATLGKALDSL